MEIAIADREKTPMWYIVGTEIFLSYEEPGPIVVDASKLTADQLNTIRAATNARVIVTKGLEEVSTLTQVQKSLGKSYAVIPADVYKTASLSVTDMIIDPAVDVLDRQNNRKKELKSLLNKPLYTAKKNLVGLSMSDLKLALTVEREGKGRASVISVINDMITKFSDEVSQHIADNETDSILKEKPLSPQLTEIEESDDQSVEVDVGSSA